MRKLLLVVAAAVGIGAWWAWGSYFVSAPLVRKSGAAVVVGEDQGDHALFSMKPERVLSACNIGYQYNSFGMGGGDLRKLGGRALISYVDIGEYQQMAAVQCSTGQCMASMLNEKERNGGIGHLLLIPENAEVMGQMEKLTLDAGAKFSMRGRDLEFQDGVIGGKHFGGRIRGLDYFLVKSIGKD